MPSFTTGALHLLSVLDIASAAAIASAPFQPPGQGNVPVATPTGALCAGQTPTTTAAPTNLPSAVAGCSNIQLTGTNDTRNDILDGICKPNTLIFARGTFEDPNLGNIVGPPFVAALEDVFGAGNLAVQGVNDYPAGDVDYCLGGSLTGAENLASVRQYTRSTTQETQLTNLSSSSSKPCPSVPTPSSPSAATAKAAKSCTTVSRF